MESGIPPRMKRGPGGVLLSHAVWRGFEGGILECMRRRCLLIGGHSLNSPQNRSSVNIRPMRRSQLKTAVVKTLAFLLLFSVATLSTAAKHRHYLPESHPVHHLAKAARMHVKQVPIDFLPLLELGFGSMAPPQAKPVPFVPVQEQLEFRQIDYTVSRQHRSPPSSLD